MQAECERSGPREESIPVIVPRLFNHEGGQRGEGVRDGHIVAERGRISGRIACDRLFNDAVDEALTGGGAHRKPRKAAHGPFAGGIGRKHRDPATPRRSELRLTFEAVFKDELYRIGAAGEHVVIVALPVLCEGDAAAGIKSVGDALAKAAGREFILRRFIAGNGLFNGAIAVARAGLVMRRQVCKRMAPPAALRGQDRLGRRHNGTPVHAVR